jgi:hypothetical protein
MKALTVAVLIPTTGRAQQLEQRVSRLLMQEPPRDVCVAVVLAIPATDSETMAAATRLQRHIHHARVELHVVERQPGTNAVEGWLLAFEYAAYNGADWFVLGADDLVWSDNWLRHALATASATGAGVIGLNDGHTNQADYSSHFMMSRLYAEMHGFIPEVYQSWWFDREVCQAAQLRGQYAASPRALVEHRHPDWQTAQMDATYQAAWPLHDVDKAVYERRRLNGFRS